MFPVILALGIGLGVAALARPKGSHDPGFDALVRDAVSRLQQDADPVMAEMARTVPVYVREDATLDEQVTGECVGCKFEGLWVDRPLLGYRAGPHGFVVVYRQGTVHLAEEHRLPLAQEVYLTVRHEFDHARGLEHPPNGGTF